MKRPTQPRRLSGPISEQYLTGEYGARCPTWHKEDSEWKIAQLLKTVPRTFWQPTDKSRISILDIGCGAGAVLGCLSGHLSSMGIAYRMLGIDLTDEPFHNTRTDWPDIEFRVQKVEDICESFDIGLLMDVVEHVENPWELIREAKHRCRNLVFHIPLDDTVLTELGNLYAYKANSMGHIQFYTRRKVLWLLESCGLEILFCRFTSPFSVPSSLSLSIRHRLLSYPRKALASISAGACARWLGGMSLMVVTRSH